MLQLYGRDESSDTHKKKEIIAKESKMHILRDEKDKVKNTYLKIVLHYKVPR